MTARALAAWRLFSAPATIGGRRYPSIGLVLLAVIGACFLVVVAVGRWDAGQDQEAYRLGALRLINGQPLYDPTATSITPFAYWYPPPLAQALVPIAAVLPSRVFDLAWVGLLLGCLLWMARWRPLVALAYVAFVPVAVELWFDNVHLVLAALDRAGDPALAVGVRDRGGDQDRARARDPVPAPAPTLARGGDRDRAGPGDPGGQRRRRARARGPAS